jgi:Family of unknown function (DUF6157)
MKIHTTNYKDTLILIAEDCPSKIAEVPPTKDDKKTIANMQFDILYNHPYQFTSDEVLFQIFVERNSVPISEIAEAREQFFIKGQPCMRCSPLAKRYGWGIHHNKEGKVALIGADSDDYSTLSKDNTINIVKAMKSSK